MGFESCSTTAEAQLGWLVVVDIWRVKEEMEPNEVERASRAPFNNELLSLSPLLSCWQWWWCWWNSLRPVYCINKQRDR